MPSDDAPLALTKMEVQENVLRARLERIFSRVQSCYDLGTSLREDSSALLQFTTRYKRLHESYAEFEKVLEDLHSLSLTLDPTTKADSFAQRLAAFEDMYFRTCAIHEKYVKCSPEREKSGAPIQQKSVRLPEIELQTFDGTLSQWPLFRSNFQSLIHENESLDKTAKFHYLRSALRGTALASICELTLTADNYSIAWQALIKRYNNKRVLGTELLSKLLNFPQAKRESEFNVSQFLASFNEGVSALKSLKLPDLSDFILLQIAVKCLPIGLYKAFERAHVLTELPTLKELLTFAEQQSRILELIQTSDKKDVACKSDLVRDKYVRLQKKVFVASIAKIKNCPKCKMNHLLMKCPIFLKSSILERHSFVKDNKLCYNCLKEGHTLNQCIVKSSCRTCGKRHHSLIHLNSQSKYIPPNSRHVKISSEEQSDVINEYTSDKKCVLTAKAAKMVLLGTAVIKIKGSDNKFYKVRAVIDPGSMSSFLSIDCVKKLGLKINSTEISVTGIADQPMHKIFGITECLITPSNLPKPVLATETFVIPCVTDHLPVSLVPRDISVKFKHLDLADPEFDTPGAVHALLGADLFPHIFTGDKILGVPSEPSALNSIFGWIIIGKYVVSSYQPQKVLFCNLPQDPIEPLLRKFWETEDIQTQIPENAEDKACTNIYDSQHTRDSLGRYVVPLLMKSTIENLGSSYASAKTRFLNLEKRLERHSQLRKEYCDFMEEYEQLGHMTPVAPSNAGQAKYYIPHHCVIKEQSTSTRVRVVFDASMRTTTGVSLNDVLLPGPKLQQDIFNILFRFRLHQFVFSADICKMYRQILVLPSHRSYQHILWRSDAKQPLTEYQLNTVTYGLACSPYLAQKTIHQLAADYASHFPNASRIALTDFYVDDILTGAPSIEEARELQRELVELLKTGGFELRKWSSNHSDVLSNVLPEHIESNLELSDEDRSIKILGVRWQSQQDCFSYQIMLTRSIYTKRSVLSNCARIFDPLGWVTPVVLKIKILLQKLWLLGLDWDDELPDSDKADWDLICEKLPNLSRLSIPRISLLANFTQSDLIGFSDASQCGYGAVVYLRTQNCANEVKLTLLVAKSKVAPIKTISIPRLELCGALLLAKLLDKTRKLFEPFGRLNNIYAFSDSSVTLTWLKSPPCKLKTFIANRVTYILEKTDPSMWFHVPTECNPADLASRGCLASELIDNDLWWNGPSWLHLNATEWPVQHLHECSVDSQLEFKSAFLDTSVNCFVESKKSMIEEFSSFWKLVRITAWILRFFFNCRTAPSKRKVGNLATYDLHLAELTLTRSVQKNAFKDAAELVKQHRSLPRHLQRLQPFLDEDGLLRVRGRLSNASIMPARKHPILLPKNSHFTTLLIDYWHVKYLHIGPRTLHSLLATKYWILSARQIIRSRLSKCITCFRVQPRQIYPMMGNLPAPRFCQGRPFINVGTDFGGPFLVKETSLRKARIFKVYICLFICLATRAIHVELVSDLSASAFIAAFDRFVGRRGLCHNIFSDNGTNYVGANNVLKNILTFLRKKEIQQPIQAHATQNGVNWHFSPPSGPHFGGIWEAGIKSTKYHLKRSIGDQLFTFEEFNTILIKIEAILNSRPLCSLTDDPAEIDVLTPGHFLTGAPLVARPEINVTDVPQSRLSRWQLLEQTTQSFWKKWNVDYLHTLNQRAKWTADPENIKIGTIVLINDSNLPPTRWKLGRVEAVFPGKDNIVRVVKVKTKSGSLMRPVVKISPLPFID